MLRIGRLPTPTSWKKKSVVEFVQNLCCLSWECFAYCAEVFIWKVFEILAPLVPPVPYSAKQSDKLIGLCPSCLSDGLAGVGWVGGQVF